MTKAALFWSGGKDSALALFYIQQFYPELVITRLITTLNPDFGRISMHGVREQLLDKQAAMTGTPLQKMWVPSAANNKVYEEKLHEVLAGLREDGITHAVFGDIFLEDLKLYRDNLLEQHGLTGVYPLWKKPESELLDDLISNGFSALTCCISSKYLGKDWLGRVIDRDFIRDLPVNVNPCGENGEFHTFCTAGPIFKKPVPVKKGNKEYRPLTIPQLAVPVEETGFYYLDLY